MNDEIRVEKADAGEFALWVGRLKDERDQPRSPSLTDVLAKLREIEGKLDVLVDEVSSQRART